MPLTVHMPVIAPPPPGTDPATHYGAVMGATSVQVETAANYGLKIALSNPAYRQLFATVGGTITFIPAGNPLPTAGAEPSLGAGSVVLKIWVVDVTELKRVLPPGVRPMTSVLYLNVKADSLRASLDPLVRALPEPALRAVWTGPSSPANRAEMEDYYLNTLMIGQTELLVPAGTPLGEAGSSDPANPAGGVDFTLRFTDGTGSDLSPILHLRGMPSYGGAQWTGHPLVSALSGLPVPVDIYLQFEVWNETSKAFESLPAGVEIDVMEADPMFNDVLATQNTDSQGRVHFSFPDLQATAGEMPDIFFRARPNGLNHAGHTLPHAWSTNGWLAADGRPGYYPSFAGTQLGSAASPLVFRIGLDFHVRLTYQDKSKSPPTFTPAPKGIWISLWSMDFQGNTPWTPQELFVGSEKKTMLTDDNGEIHGVTFNIQAGDSIYWRVMFQIEDAAIKLPRASVGPLGPFFWATSWLDADEKDWPNNDWPFIGTQSSPELLRCTANDRNVWLYFLTIVRELSTFLFHMTNGGWTGVQQLTLYPTSISGIAYSWPVGSVHIPPNDHWRRGTIIHELSHQIMWKEVNYSSLGIAYEAGRGLVSATGLSLYHQHNLLDDPVHALIEGWAEFMQTVFAGTTTPPYSVSMLVDKVSGQPTYPLGPPPNNRGESVEGAFADGLWGVFKNHVVTPAVSGTARVPASVNGDVTVTAPWIQNSAVQQRFLSMIWEPLKDLKSPSHPSTTDMFDYMKTRNPTVWHRLQPELQTFNMAMAIPTIASVAPSSGPSAGGQMVTINGTNFVMGAQVTIGGPSATNIIVVNSSTITADTHPGTPGPADIIVTTPAGSAMNPGGYTYQ